MRGIIFPLIFLCSACFAQNKWPHANAHAHNDYEHHRPLRAALENGFISVEVDVHWQNERLLVAHDQTTDYSPTLESLYLIPLDSIQKKNNGWIYPGSKEPFYLMIDIKTEGESTYRALRELLGQYPGLLCHAEPCTVKVFLSGERPLATMLQEGYKGLGIDGRTEDLGKGYSVEQMPVISDTYKAWASWNGLSKPVKNDLQRINDLAKRTHAEGKKLRLYAIPDNEVAWEALLNAGVDLINTDHLLQLSAFLQQKGL
jgi:glycerophosphoryl diester phosphodiesterase